jgi:hypothetical protein
MRQGRQITSTDNALMRQEAYAHRYKTVQPYHPNPGQCPRTCGFSRYARSEIACCDWAGRTIGHGLDRAEARIGQRPGGRACFLARGGPDGGIGPPTHRRNHLRDFCHFSQDPPGCPGSPPNRRDPPRTPTNPHTALPGPPSPLSQPHSHPAATATAATSRKQRRASVLA